MYHCNICNKDFSNIKSYAGHMSSHNRNDNYKIGRKKKIENKKETHICIYCGKSFNSGISLGGHTGSCLKNPNIDKKILKLRNSATGKRFSQETINQISKSMILAHKEGRAWNIGKSRWNNEKSWPEKFFERFLKQNNISYTCEYPIGIYSIDFVILGEKMAIEIDGKQHFEDIKQMERDKNKNILLKTQNWKILRIKWTRLFNDTQNTLQETLNWINNPSEFKLLY